MKYVNSQKLFVSRLKEVKQSIEGFKEEHSQANEIITHALESLPYPFDKFSTLLWRGFDKKDTSTIRILSTLEEISIKDKESFNRIESYLVKILDHQTSNEDIEHISNLIKNSNRTLSDILEPKLNQILKISDNIDKKFNKIENKLEEKVQIKNTKFDTLSPKSRSFRGEKPIFFGRNEEFNIIKNYLKESKMPIAIIGLGGIGKTTFAFKAIHQNEKIFDLIIPLYFESKLTYNDVLSKIQNYFVEISKEEFQKLNESEREETIVSCLEKSNVIIFADNFESILDNEVNIEFFKIKKFFNRITNVTYVILTSRTVQNLDLERTIKLKGLTEEEGLKFFLSLTKKRMGDPSSNLMKIVKKIVKKIGGHPLSLEIIARNYEGSGIKELEEKLDDVGLSDFNTNDTEKRLQTIEKCFEYSIEKLTPELQKKISLLTLFKSPFLKSSAKMILNFEEKEISKLYNNSLLNRIDFDNHGLFNEEFQLYQFHPHIRNYLEVIFKNKENDFDEKFTKKICSFYNDFLDDVLSALKNEKFLPIIRIFYIMTEGQENDFDKALDASNDTQSIKLATDLGMIFYYLEKYEKSLTYFNKCLEVHQRSQDYVGLAIDYVNIGNIFSQLGRSNEALENYQNALKLHEQEENTDALARDYCNVGITLGQMENLEQALEYLIKSKNIHERLNDKKNLAIIFGNISLVLRKMKEFFESRNYLEKSISIRRNYEDDFGLAADYNNMGLLLQDMNLEKEALENVEIAMELNNKFPNENRLAIYYGTRGVIFRKMNKFEESFEDHSKALEINKRKNNRFRMSENTNNLGLVLEDMGKFEESLKFYKNALHLRLDLNNKFQIAESYSNMSRIFKNMGKLEDAKEYDQKATNIFSKLKKES